MCVCVLACFFERNLNPKYYTHVLQICFIISSLSVIKNFDFKEKIIQRQYLNSGFLFFLFYFLRFDSLVCSHKISFFPAPTTYRGGIPAEQQRTSTCVYSYSSRARLMNTQSNTAITENNSCYHSSESLLTSFTGVKLSINSLAKTWTAAVVQGCG